MCSTAPSCQQPLVMGLGSGMFSMKYPPPTLHFSCPPLLGGLWVSCSLRDWKRRRSPDHHPPPYPRQGMCKGG